MARCNQIWNGHEVIYGSRSVHIYKEIEMSIYCFEIIVIISNNLMELKLLKIYLPLNVIFQKCLCIRVPSSSKSSAPGMFCDHQQSKPTVMHTCLV